MNQQKILTKSNVNLVELSNQLSLNYNLPLTIEGYPSQHHDIDLLLEKKHGVECLSLARNYSERVLDYEQFSAYHHSGANEYTKVYYFSSHLEYFIRTFQDVKDVENEFLTAIKQAYEEILRTISEKSRAPIPYEKRIANDQKTLEEIFNYAAFKFSKSKASV